jgi:hypothetical protein
VESEFSQFLLSSLAVSSAGSFPAGAGLARADRWRRRLGFIHGSLFQLVSAARYRLENLWIPPSDPFAFLLLELNDWRNLNSLTL